MSRCVFDCFTFFDEYEILELRLREHWSCVDRFVLVEADKTFTGNPKPMHFHNNRERFRPFLEKIIYVPVTDIPETENVWVREEFQREAIFRGLQSAGPDDLIITSDVDEIQRLESIQTSRTLDGLIQYKLDMFQYYFNMRERINSWTPAFAFSYKYREAMAAASIGSKSLSYGRFRLDQLATSIGIPLHRLDNAGWHFTHLGGTAKLYEKFAAYSHSNDPWPSAMKNEKMLHSQIALGAMIGFIDRPAEYVPIDHTFPAHIRDNLDHYKRIDFIQDVHAAFKSLQKMQIDLKREFALSMLTRHETFDALGGVTPLQYVELRSMHEVPRRYLNLPPTNGTLISAGKTATQSSTSEWSEGRSREADAMRAMDGNINGYYRFHTDWEDDPWWQIDLGPSAVITEIRIFNRVFPASDDRFIQARARDITISISRNGHIFEQVFSNEGGAVFGGLDGRPLIWAPAFPLLARFVKLALPGYQILHLDQVEIYGLIA